MKTDGDHRREKKAVCSACMHGCSLEDGQYGRCRARKNDGGRIVCANYGMITSMMLDPVEKKPLARFMPGSRVLSVGSFGCNLSCPFCQNHEISMAGEGDITCRKVTPEELAELAAAYRNRGNIGIAFTYNEPLVGYEFVRDTAKFIHDAGMKNVLVTNGSFGINVLDEILPYIDAMNIDLKCFTDEGYTKLGGDLDTVKRFIEKAASSCHVEITTLIVPGMNDFEEEMDEEARWIASVDRNIPLHVTRYFPRFRMTEGKPTDVKTVRHLRRTAAGHLKYVYTGNC